MPQGSQGDDGVERVQTRRDDKRVGCVECHRAHDNKFGRLLRKPATELCFTCHEKMQAQIAAAKFKHRPVSDNSCVPATCHMARSMANCSLPIIRLPPYPPTIPPSMPYASLAMRREIVRERYVDNQTDFRNGRLNLHYLHVNRRERRAHLPRLPRCAREQPARTDPREGDDRELGNSHRSLPGARPVAVALRDVTRSILTTASIRCNSMRNSFAVNGQGPDTWWAKYKRRITNGIRR